MADDPMGTGTVTDTSELSGDDLLREIVRQQEEHRAEVAKLREELDARKAPAPTGFSATVKSAEELFKERLEEVAHHSHYCPGCGKLVDYPQQCVGTPQAPHPPIEVVETGELQGEDPSAHTAAPNTDNLG